MPDLDELLALAVRLAEDAGALLAEHLHAERTLVETKSSLTDMVSEIDRASEALIAGGLRAARPDDAIVGEEGTSREGSSGICWVIDPLDGTTNYLYGYPAFAVSIAAQFHGRTIVGVVRDAAHGETFTAAEGRGAMLDGRAIAPSGGAQLSTALVSTGFSYVAERRARQAAVLSHVLPLVRDVRRGGAAALDLCWVACGRVDAFFEQGLAPWDLAAGALIVEAAGGVTGDLDGGPPSTSFTLAAATPELAEPLRRLLRDAGA